MTTEPEPQHDRSEPENKNGTDANEHWPWGRSDSGDE